MMKRIALTLTLTLTLTLSALSLSACHDHAGVDREPDEYIGCATDENWATFDDVTDVVSDTQAPQLTMLTGASLANTPAVFTWKQSSTVESTSAGDVPATCDQFNTGFTTLHLEPVSGNVYDLQVSVGGEVKHRVITTLQKWQASPAVWSSFGGSTISVKIRRMVLLNNDRKDGPYVTSTPYTASVAKF